MPTLKKILYAEEDAEIRTVVELTIQALCDKQIKICEDTQELLEAIEEFEPDIMLLHANMFEEDGIAILKNLRSKNKAKHVPAIFLIKGHEKFAEDELNELGVIGFIKKPFNPLELCKNIKKIWCSYLDDKTSDPESCCCQEEHNWKCE